MTVTPAQSERSGLADDLTARGPDARTLCDGWTTADLASHVVLRERRPLVAAGILLPPLAGYTQRSMRKLRETTEYADLVAMVRAGAQRWSPLQVLPALDSAVNTTELFVHHEDVRRTGPDAEPRELSPELQSALWKQLRRGARLMMRTAPVGVILRAPDGTTATGKRGSTIVVVSGPVGELVLFASGRQRVAQVKLDGSADAVAALRSAKLGL
jgi:uncharacterized protein (TIGR03085 family)